MPKFNAKKLIILFGDIIILYVGLFSTLIIRGYSVAPGWASHKIPFLWVHIIWLLIFFSAGMYDWEHFPPTRRYYTLQLTAKTMLFSIFSAILLFYLIPEFSITPRANLFVDATIVTVFLWLWRNFFIRKISQKTKIKVLFFGKNPETEKFAAYLEERETLGYKVELIADHFQFDHNNIKSFIKQNNIDLVVVSKDISQNKELLRMFYEVLPLGVVITNFPAFYESITGKVPVSLINETWFLENLAELNSKPYETAKRILDLATATALSVPALILAPAIALLIKLDSRGPVFFYQRRVGKNGKIFEFIKFRSMKDGAERVDGTKGDGNDSRHTQIGKILRKTYLDELPQIINVFRGEMSFVGPRPERPEFVEILLDKVPFYETRLLANPGITGWAQIRMQNDASVEDASEKLQYDLYYVKNRSLLMDLGIMLKTASIMVKRSGR
ncbi:MAG: sugar transferase [Candidatus Azambacteria bacterium]|nr:sugar transferase [Candidatus Azambacteria bacterium]